MDNVLISFLITVLAGFSTILGTFPIFLKKDKDIISKSLLFASGVMFTVSVTDLIPESIKCLIDVFYLIPAILIFFIFFVFGSISSLVIEAKTPKKENNLYRVGIISMIAIFLHNVPEGIATFMCSSNNISLGILMSIAIALHNIPEGISIATPIYYATGSRGKALFYTVISGFSEILGAIIAFIFLYRFINNFSLGILYSFIGGIMIYISIFELIPEAKKQIKYNYTYFFLGSFVMILTHLLLN